MTAVRICSGLPLSIWLVSKNQFIKQHLENIKENSLFNEAEHEPPSLTIFKSHVLKICEGGPLHSQTLNNEPPSHIVLCLVRLKREGGPTEQSQNKAEHGLSLQIVFCSLVHHLRLCRRALTPPLCENLFKKVIYNNPQPSCSIFCSLVHSKHSEGTPFQPLVVPFYIFKTFCPQLAHRAGGVPKMKNEFRTALALALEPVGVSA